MRRLRQLPPRVTATGGGFAVGRDDRVSIRRSEEADVGEFDAEYGELSFAVDANVSI